jgi:hypothetical protein
MIFYRGTETPPNKVSENGFKTHGAEAAPKGMLLDWFQAQLLLDKHKHSVKDMAFAWRKQTPGGLIATSATEMGAWEQTKYVYRIDYSQLYIFTLQNDGAPGPFGSRESNALALGSKYALLSDRPTLEALPQATVLALYHGVVDSKEVTFMNPIPPSLITGYRPGGTQNRGQFKPLSAFTPELTDTPTPLAGRGAAPPKKLDIAARWPPKG